MRHGRYELFEKPSNFTGDETLLPAQDPSMEIVAASDWSADGRFVVAAAGSSSDVNLWMFPMTGDRKPFPFVRARGMQTHARFSPDGGSVAYETNESGQNQVWVTGFPESVTGRYQISRSGGTQPVWARGTGELFFLAPGGAMMAVKDVHAPLPQKLFSVQTEAAGFGTVYDVTRDGSRFLVNVRPAESEPSTITIVLNWPALLESTHPSQMPH
jgi:hypothetical protein